MSGSVPENCVGGRGGTGQVGSGARVDFGRNGDSSSPPQQRAPPGEGCGGAGQERSEVEPGPRGPPLPQVGAEPWGAGRRSPGLGALTGAVPTCVLHLGWVSVSCFHSEPAGPDGPVSWGCPPNPKWKQMCVFMHREPHTGRRPRTAFTSKAPFLGEKNAKDIPVGKGSFRPSLFQR